MLTIRDLRRRRGLTQRDLGGGVRHITDIEAGKRMPGAILLKRIAAALGMKPEEVYDICRVAYDATHSVAS
jgi:transcriptional regulator with XRE-family HTH domain